MPVQECEIRFSRVPEMELFRCAVVIHPREEILLPLGGIACALVETTAIYSLLISILILFVIGK